jgi:hypothetical protein
MTNISLSSGATALLLMSGGASAQNLPSQDKINAPTALQSTTPDKPPVATVPEAATDAAAIPPKGDNGASAQRIEENGCRNGQFGRPTGVARRTVTAQILTGDEVKNGCSSAPPTTAEEVKARREGVQAHHHCLRGALFSYRRSLYFANKTTGQMAFQTTDFCPHRRLD